MRVLPLHIQDQLLIFPRLSIPSNSLNTVSARIENSKE